MHIEIIDGVEVISYLLPVNKYDFDKNPEAAKLLFTYGSKDYFKIPVAAREVPKDTPNSSTVVRSNITLTNEQIQQTVDGVLAAMAAAEAAARAAAEARARARRRARAEQKAKEEAEAQYWAERNAWRQEQNAIRRQKSAAANALRAEQDAANQLPAKSAPAKLGKGTSNTQSTAGVSLLNSSSKQYDPPNPGPKNGYEYTERNGELHKERWYGEEGEPIHDRHHTDHGNSKNHPNVPHDHDWYEDANGDRSLGEDTLPNPDYKAPAKEDSRESVNEKNDARSSISKETIDVIGTIIVVAAIIAIGIFTGIWIPAI